MYKIYADDTLIYDSTVEDYKINKGSITLEINKSGSFSFSIYPDHFYYDDFIPLKTVIKVSKAGKIVFRGRILNDVTDYWNNKNITCEGELGFLNDSIIRPFDFTGTPTELFTKFIQEHNSQVDEFKQFKIGKVTVVDSNDYVARSTTGYDSTINILNSATINSSLGGYIYIDHGEDGTEDIPTIHYLADFENIASQSIEFGSNLKNYTKTVKSEDIATAIIPLGTVVGSNDKRLTIEDINDGLDYVYSDVGVELYGWIFKTATWDDVTIDHNLKTKAIEYLNSVVNKNITIELNAIDLNLLDKNIESFNVCDYVEVNSDPHNFHETLLCNKQTLDILNPQNDSIVLGFETVTFTGTATNTASTVSSLKNEMSSIKQTGNEIELKVEDLDNEISQTLKIASDGVTIVNNEGDAVTIDGGQIKANSITAESIDATNLTVSAGNITGSLTIGQLPTDVATTDDIPTKTSQLTNNSGYQTASGVVSIIDGTIDADYINALGITARELEGDAVWLKRNGYYYGVIYVGENSEGTDAIELKGYNGLRLTSQQNVYISSGWTSRLLLNVSGAYIGPNVYQTDGTQITSDRNRKHDIEYDIEKYDVLFDNLKPTRFKYDDGTSDRYHIGLIAQDVGDAILSADLSTQDFAGYSKVPIYETDKNGNSTDNIIDYTYALRYDEFIALNIRQIQLLKERVKELEDKLLTEDKE